MIRFLRILTGALVTAISDVLVNLIAAGIQKRPFVDQLISTQGIWILVVLFIAVLVMAILLERSHRPSSSKPVETQNPNGISLSNSRLFWSTTVLKGKGIHVDKITSVGSKNEADTSN